MTIDQKQKLYAEGNHICVFAGIMGDGWKLSPDGVDLSGNWDQQLIHKKHSHVLEASLRGCKVTWVGTSDTVYDNTDDFIKEYDDTIDYLAIPNSLDSCYCEATELHYNHLYNVAKQPNEPLDFNAVFSQKYYVIFPEGQEREHRSKVWAQLNNSMTQVEFNEQIYNWTYCPKENEDENSNITTTKDIKQKQLQENLYNNGLNNFPEFGYTADFEGTAKYDEYLGCLIGEAGNNKILWDVDGEAYVICSAPHRMTDYDLTIIIPKVAYTNLIFKKRKRDGVIVKFTTPTTGLYLLHETRIGEFENALDSRDGSWEDLPYDTKRGLYHGQPIYEILGGQKGRAIDLFNINTIYSSIKPIPLDTLATMPFIWDMHKSFINRR